MVVDRDFLRQLGGTLSTEFQDAETARQIQEKVWLEDWRMYRGVYDPEVLARIPDDRCRLFFRKPKIKTDTIIARLMDILFPRSGQANWRIEPTPIPSFDRVTEILVSMLVAEGGDEQAVRVQIAKERAEAMSREIADTLAESKDWGMGYRPGYREVVREVITSACRYGTGILKGPLTEANVRQKWGWGGGPDGREGWRLTSSNQGFRPSYRAVSPWNFFPDPAARAWPGGCRYTWEQYLMMPYDLRHLAGESSFYGDVIRDLLARNKGGDAQEKDYVSQIRQGGEGRGMPSLAGRFRIYERWGWMSRTDLVDGGLEVEDGADEIFCNAWVMCGEVIKLVSTPLRGVRFPYHLFQFEPDEGGILSASGVPRVMRDVARALNAAYRASIDNAAATAGPIVGINKQALSPDSGDPTKLSPYSVKLFDTHEDMQKAMQVWQIQSSIREIKLIMDVNDQMGDELTTPRWVHGDGNVADAAKTASGMSMLMGALNINLQELVKQYDDKMTSPFIGALYFWHMDFNPKPEIKGDYAVVATGATALMAKEIRVQQLIQFVQLTESPRWQGTLDDVRLMAELVSAMDLPGGIALNAEQIRARKLEEMSLAAEAEARGRIRAVVAEMQANGVPVPDVLARLAGRFMSEAQPQPGAEPAPLPAAPVAAQGLAA